MNKDYFFLTNRENYVTSLYTRQANNSYKKYIYYPQKYETMSNKKIKNFQK